MKATHLAPLVLAITFILSGCSKGEEAKEAAPKESAQGQKAKAPKAAAAPKARALGGQWAPAGELPLKLERPLALELPDGRVFAYGNGEDPRGALWDPKTNTWSPTAPSKRPRGEAAGSLLDDGTVLVTGGVHIPKGHYVLRSSEIYDPKSERWRDAGNTGDQRRGHAHLRLSDGRIALVGGVGGGFAAPTRKISAFDPKGGKYPTIAELGVGRSFHAVMGLGDERFIVVGGQDKEGPLKSVELCTLGKKRCRVIPRPLARERAALARLKSGDVLITGGVKRRAGGATEVLYDPGKGTFAPTGAMAKLRNDHSLTLLKDGRALAIGGEKGAASSAEVYDPEAKAWAKAPSPAQGRHGHAALRLKDGSVLIVGGVSAEGKAVLKAERLTPGT